MGPLEPIMFWHWWALGGILAMIEVFAPGVMFLWLGVAAGLVGALLLLWPGLDLAVQILIFAVLSVTSVLTWRRYQRAHPVVTDEPNLNRRAARYIGERTTLVTPIVNGRGRIRLGDSSWPALGPDLPAGTTVEVVAVDGTVLRVAPVGAADGGPTPAEPPAPAPTPGPA